METERVRKPPKKLINPHAVFLGFVAVAVIAGGSFYAGIGYQKTHQNTSVAGASTAASQPSNGGRAGFGSRSGRIIGQVTAISATNISVQNSRTGTTATLAITSATQISDNGQTVSASDIQVGSMVFITEDTSNTSQAARILVNPGYGGGFGGPQSSPSSSSPSVTPTVSVE